MPTIPPDARRSKLLLLTITVVGGLLRFAWLDHPCLWGDEALVYWRTCGSYGELLTPLRADGFPPLHYELFWVIVHALGHTPGPVAMRAVAAACGTMTVPAIYFVARQLLSRRASLTAAVFTACSAFALFYSRDAKMYAEAWLAMTASVGCLLWWLRTGRSTAWLGWVAAGAAAGGLQTLTLVSVAGLCPLLLLTQRRAHWRQTLTCLAGMGLIVAGPVGYYARFNGWTENVDRQGWGASGIAWVQWMNFNRAGPDQARYLATTFLTGWEWPRPGPVERMPIGRLRLLKGGTVAVGVVLLAGLLPWRGIVALGVGLRRRLPRVEAPDVHPGLRREQDAPTEPPWRAALWLTAWIALPSYGFYCRSVPGFAPPFTHLGIADHPRLWIASISTATIALAVAMALVSTRSSAVRWLQLTLVFAGLLAACQGMAVGMAAAARAAAAEGQPWQSVWVPRYLGFVWPAVAIVVGVLVDRLPGWPTRLAALAVVLGMNLGMFAYRLVGWTEPPVDRMAADVWAARPPADGGEPAAVTWMGIRDYRWTQTGPGSGNLFSDPGRYYLQLLAQRPMGPGLFKDSLSTFEINSGGDMGRAVRRAIGPKTQRVIVWEQFADPPAAVDKLLPQLEGWQRASDESFPIREVWSAKDGATYRRREYRRSPATRP